MIVHGNRAGWWNEHIHKQFLAHHFGKRDFSQPVLLLLDDFSGHWTAKTQAYATEINVHTLRIPPGYTSVCQPADVAWMRPFKDVLRSEWIQSLSDQLDRRVPGTPFKMTGPSETAVCDWVVKAWDGVSNRVVRAGYERAHMEASATELVERMQELSLVDTTIGDVDSDQEFDA